MFQRGKRRENADKSHIGHRSLSSLAPSVASSAGPSMSLPSISVVASNPVAAHRSVEPHVKKALDEGHKKTLEGYLPHWPRKLLHSYTLDLSENASHYSPLPTLSSIRLLTIHTGDTASMITCSLRVANLEDEPKFKALSYSWVKDGSWIKNTISFISNISIGRDHGKTMDSEEESQDLTTREILCNGRTMNVYQNLYDALLQLRKSCPGDYWIDAICINQGDLLERNQQVQIMDQIYGCAETVTVWLGVCPDVLASAMAKIEQKKGILPKSGYSKVLSQISEVMVTVPYLLSRRYFSRLWVLQEICLAKRLELFIGEHRISPQTLISLTEWSSDPTGSDAESTIPVMLATLQSVRPYMAHVPLIPHLLRTREKLQQGGILTLEQWLELVKGREASDPRDFVNAGLSVIKADDLTINQNLYARDKHEAIELWSKLDVDYSLGTYEVLLNLAACFLSKPSGVRLLSFASRVRDAFGVDADYSAYTRGTSYQVSIPLPLAFKVNDIASNRTDFKVGGLSGLEEAHGKGLVTLPSWIPNLGSWSSRYLDTFTSQGITTFATCTSLDAQPSISSDLKTLYVSAVKLAEINTRSYNPLKDRKHKTLLDLAATLPTTYTKTGESGLEALAEICPAGTWAKTQDRSALRGLLRWLRCGELDAPQRRTLPMYKKKPERSFAALEAQYKDLPWDELRKQVEKSKCEVGDSFLEDSLRLLMGRSFFTTEEGYWGLGPSWLATGDTVMLVKGAHVPYVFRHADRILMARSRAIKDELADKKATLSNEKREALQDALKRTEEKIGQRDAWVLIGEAYVRGVMEGQAVTPETEFRTIEIV